MRREGYPGKNQPLTRIRWDSAWGFVGQTSSDEWPARTECSAGSASCLLSTRLCTMVDIILSDMAFIRCINEGTTQCHDGPVPGGVLQSNIDKRMPLQYSTGHGVTRQGSARVA
jgi:hypothetical protein